MDLIERVFVMRSFGAFVIAAFAGRDVVFEVIEAASAFRDEMVFGRILTARAAVTIDAVPVCFAPKVFMHRRE